MSWRWWQKGLLRWHRKNKEGKKFIFCNFRRIYKFDKFLKVPPLFIVSPKTSRSSFLSRPRLRCGSSYGNRRWMTFELIIHVIFHYRITTEFGCLGVFTTQKRRIGLVDERIRNVSFPLEPCLGAIKNCENFCRLVSFTVGSVFTTTSSPGLITHRKVSVET